MNTRAEYLDWCKKRALEHCDRNDTTGAITSMFLDLSKHPEMANHAGIQIGLGLLMIGALSSQADARRFIEGFN